MLNHIALGLQVEDEFTVTERRMPVLAPAEWAIVISSIW
jgi:hypothetical protein